MENSVKQIIIGVSELPGSPERLNPDTKLSDLGFNDNMCNDLAQRLDDFVKTLNPSASVHNSEINPSMTVQEVIDLVKSKLS